MPSYRSKGILLLAWVALAMPASELLAQSLLYEREFTMIGMQDNTLRMELTESGELTIERPAFMTHSGRHELAVQSSIYSELGDQLAARYADSRNLSSDIQQRARQDMRYVSDPEISRFYRLDQQGRKLDHVSGISLEAWADVYPDDQRLASLRNLERQWYQLMQRALEDNR